MNARISEVLISRMSEQDGESYRTKYGYNKKGYVTSESIFTKDDGETPWKKSDTTSITRNVNVSSAKNECCSANY